jgi:hypothetical protein
LCVSHVLGPPEKDKAFYKMRDEENKIIHHSYKGSEKKTYRNKMEDWESAKVRKRKHRNKMGDWEKAKVRKRKHPETKWWTGRMQR